MGNYFYRLCLLFLLSSGCCFNSLASHLLGGEIKVDKVQGAGLRYKITLLNYIDKSSAVAAGGLVNFGDGTEVDIASNDFLISQEPLNEKIILNTYEFFHTFSGPGLYVVSFQESNRNAGVLNIPGAIQTPFYVESLIVVDPFLGTNTQPAFSFAPVDVATSGKAYFYNPGAYDPDGDSLSYQLVVPKQAVDANVDDYSFPNDILFYAGVDYDIANEAMNGTPTLSIDPITGIITWDAPGSLGDYSLAFKVEEWRKVGGKWISIGFRTVDMQITVEGGSDGRPDFDIPNDTCVVANSPLQTSLLAADPDGHEVFFTTASEAYHLTGNSATFTTGNGIDTGTAFLDFNWTPTCQSARNRPYPVYFKAADRPPSGNGPSLTTYKTWNITVAGAPEGLHGQVKSVGEITLTWSDYFCSAAKSIGIYRIENSLTFPQDNCQPGVPGSSGFELITTVGPNENSFLDDNDGAGLDPNTTYCYRLVVIFRDDIGGESVASAEFCARPDEGSLVTGIGDEVPGRGFLNNISIYPNPAQTFVNIDFKQRRFKPLVVGMSDLQGKTLWQQKLLSNNDNHQISLDGIAPGMYLVWVKTPTDLVTRKIVVN